MHFIVLLYKLSINLLPKTARAQRLIAARLKQWNETGPRDDYVSRFCKRLHTQEESIAMWLPISIYNTAFNNANQMFDFLTLQNILYSATCSGSVNGKSHKVNQHISVPVNLHNLLKWSHYGLKICSQVRININKYKNKSLNNTVLLSDTLKDTSTSYFLIQIRYWTNVHQNRT